VSNCKNINKKERESEIGSLQGDNRTVSETESEIRSLQEENRTAIPCDSVLFLSFDDQRWQMLSGKRAPAVKVKGGREVGE